VTVALDDTGPVPELETARLVLRALAESDATAVAASAGDRRVARYLVQVPSPYPLALARRWVTSRIAWWREGGGLTLAIAARARPAGLIGTVALRRVAHRAELGYWLAYDAWGRGYATEAAAALVELGFADLGLDRIYAQVLEGNEPSVRVLGKLGFVHEGTKRRHARKGRRQLDVAFYAMLRPEWEQRSASRPAT
jgi:RimJ/RimL family protein N-acetyltransferase